MSDRDEFEAWFDKATNNNRGVAYYVEISGAYCFEDLEVAWQAWQAARSEAYVLRKQAGALEVLDKTLQDMSEQLRQQADKLEQQK